MYPFSFCFCHLSRCPALLYDSQIWVAPVDLHHSSSSWGLPKAAQPDTETTQQAKTHVIWWRYSYSQDVATSEAIPSSSSCSKGTVCVCMCVQYCLHPCMRCTSHTILVRSPAIFGNIRLETGFRCLVNCIGSHLVIAGLLVFEGSPIDLTLQDKFLTSRWSKQASVVVRLFILLVSHSPNK